MRDLGGVGGGDSGGGGFETSAQHTAQPPHRGARSPCIATGLDAARETSPSSLMRDFVVREDERERPSSRSSLSSSAGARSEADDYFDVRPPAPVMVTDDGTVLALTAREGRGDAFAAGLEESRRIVRQVGRPAPPRMTVLMPARRPPRNKPRWITSPTRGRPRISRNGPRSTPRNEPREITSPNRRRPYTSRNGPRSTL